MSHRLSVTYVEIDIPDFIPVQVLLNLNDTNCPAVITDENTVGEEHVWTKAGNAFIDQSDKKFGSGSLRTTAAGDYITTPDSDDFTLDAEDFTIDAWFKLNAAGGTAQDLAGQSDSANTASLRSFNLDRVAGNFMSAKVHQGSVQTIVTGTTQFTSSTNTGWHHMAFVRTGDVLKLFVDGIQEGGDVAFTGSVNDSAYSLSVGRDGEVGNSWNGWIDAFRMTVGYARWTSNFTPPTSEDDALQTMRFAIDTSYLPSDIEAIPNIIDVKMTPTVISLGEDLGQRASVTITFRDHRHILFNESYDSGTFWGKFRGRYGLKLQGRELRLIRGFVGQSLEGMETRTFVIDSLDGPNQNGEFKIIAKDLFKLADGEKAQAPTPSNGYVGANITNVATSFSLLPTGVGAEYPSSGYLNLGGKEVVSFTRSGDTMTITRSQYNTTAQAHNAQTRAQLCVRYATQDVANIIQDLLVTYAGVDSSLIPLSSWLIETGSYLAASYSALIAEPTSVNKLLSELVQQVGLALWWDDLNAQFRLQVLRQISTDADVYDDDIIIRDSLKVTEQPTKRLSQIYVYFDKISPLVNDDQLENYRSTSYDDNPQSTYEYGAPSIRKITSRWIPTGGRSFADLVVSILLSRFADPPRRLSFDIFRDESGISPTLGAGYQIDAWCFQDSTGNPDPVPVQLTSVNALADRFEVEAEEMLFAAVPPLSPADHLVIIDGSINNVNLQTLHDALYGTAASGVTVTCIIQSGVIVGSTSTSSPSFTVGTFPAGVTVNLTVIGRIEGKAGDGGSGTNSSGTAGTAGGTALYTRQAITLTYTSGQIWGGGGGGGGGGASVIASTVVPGGGGGGGGGQTPGSGGPAGGAGANAGNAGSTSSGGAGGSTGANPYGVGGTGGNPGSAGNSGANGNGATLGGAGGATGKGIDGVSHVTVSGAAGSLLGGSIN